MICKLEAGNHQSVKINMVLFKFLYPSKLAGADAPLQTIVLIFTCWECEPQEVLQFYQQDVSENLSARFTHIENMQQMGIFQLLLFTATEAVC